MPNDLNHEGTEGQAEHANPPWHDRTVVCVGVHERQGELGHQSERQTRCKEVGGNLPKAGSDSHLWLFAD